MSTEIYANPEFAIVRPRTERRAGPYAHGEAIYVFVYHLDLDTSDSELRAFKSTDDGDTWTLQDADGSPPVYLGTNIYESFSTFRVGPLVYCAYVRTPEGGFGDDEDGELTFVLFDLATDMWGAPIDGGPVVSLPSWNASANRYSWGITSVVVRTEGEVVILVDDHNTDWRRGVSLVRYDGSWLSPDPVFEGVISGGTHEFVSGSLLIDSAGLIHVFAADVHYDSSDEPSGDTNRATRIDALHCTLDEFNTVGTVHEISDELEYEYESEGAFFRYPVLGEAVEFDARVYLPYRKQDGSLCVASAPTDNTSTWTEETVVEDPDSDGRILNAMLAPVGSTALYFIWLQGIGIFERHRVADVWSEAAELGEDLLGGSTFNTLTANLAGSAVGLAFFVVGLGSAEPYSFFAFAVDVDVTPSLARYYAM